MSKKLVYFMLLISVVFLWGLSFPLMKLTLYYISPVLLLSTRFLLSAALMVPLVFKNKKLFEKNNIVIGVIGGILLFLAYYFQTVGLKYTTPSQSGLITGTYIILLPLISLLYVKLKINKIDVFAVLLGFAGLFLMSSFKISPQYAFGDILTFICAIFYAFQTVYVYKYTKFLDSLVFTFYQLLIVGVLSSLFLPFHVSFSGLHVPIVIFTVVFTAVFAGLYSYLINTRALMYIEPTAAGVVYVGEPVFAVITSIFIINEIPTVYTVIGGIIIVIAMFIETFHKYVESKGSFKVD